VKIFEEQISARKADRPELRAALEYVGEGDVLMVWKLKAASAGLFKDLVKKVEFLKQ
jgi:DNA invertase Pin-like site-specific DNA recombinase